MQRDLVEERRWISRQDYVEGLALAQLAPGPLAAQLAIYLGWVRAALCAKRRGIKKALLPARCAQTSARKKGRLRQGFFARSAGKL